MSEPYKEWKKFGRSLRHAFGAVSGDAVWNLKWQAQSRGRGSGANQAIAIGLGDMEFGVGAREGVYS